MANTPPARSNLVSVHSPADMARAAEKGRAMIEEARREAHDEGHAKGLRRAGWFRDATCLLAGVVIGAILGGMYVQNANQTGVYAAGVVTDRVLARTIDTGNDTANFFAEPPSTRDPDALIRERAGAAARGCTRGEMDAGRRGCGLNQRPPGPHEN